MTIVRTLHAEARKFLTLPAAWVATAVTVAVPVLLTWMNTRTVRHALETGNVDNMVSTSTADLGLTELFIAAIGPIIAGVVIMSSEYTRTEQTLGHTRQISTTMVTVPRRSTLLGCKLAIILGWLAVVSAAVIPGVLALSRHLLGPYTTAVDAMPTRTLGIVAYWALMALIAFALTVALRSGVIPLALLLTNSSLVSFSLLLANVTDAVRFLPDLLARSIVFSGDQFRDLDNGLPIADLEPLDPATAWASLGVWALVALIAAMICFERRDA